MFKNEYNNKNDEKDEVDRRMRPMSFGREELSDHVDLREWMSPIEYQEDMNTCCANAFAGVCEYLLNRYSNRPKEKRIDISRLFIYYNGQVLSQKTHRVIDEGVSQKNMALALREYGLCQEHIWPYKKDLLNVKPSSEAYRKARRYTVVPLKVPFNIKAIETCLHHQIPVLIDIILVNHTGRHIQENHGYLKIPNLDNSLIDKTSLHTVLLVGYNRNTKHFLTRNSWGGNWGYRGYFYMPYDYLSHKRLVNYNGGLWTIIQIIPRSDKLPSLRYLVLPKHKKNNRHKHH